MTNGEAKVISAEWKCQLIAYSEKTSADRHQLRPCLLIAEWGQLIGSVNGKANGVKSGEQDELVNSIKEFVKKGSSASQLKSFLDSLSGTPQDISDALFVALFEGVGKGFSKEVMKKKNYIAVTIQEEGSQPILLHAIEAFCGKASPEAVKEVALVLKELYDNDVLEEESIVGWYEQGLKGDNKGSPIWKNVKPFAEWLQSPESESEEE
ncbi:hypothetical protein ACS0TY_025816 [Phlomoides rotata]